jgi:hypothetical protein
MVERMLGSFVHPSFGMLCECLDHAYARPDDANEDLCWLGAPHESRKRDTSDDASMRHGCNTPVMT